MRFLVPIGLFIALFVFLFIGLYKNPSEVPSPLIGKAMPTFSLPTLNDPNKNISNQQLTGQVLLVNVWATWCFACKQEHPVLVELANTRQVPIYGLNYKDDRQKAMNWLVDFGNPYVDSIYDAAGKTAIEWGVYGAPETFVIDRKGIIRYKHIGPLTPAVLNDKILPLVNDLNKEAS